MKTYAPQTKSSRKSLALPNRSGFADVTSMDVLTSKHNSLESNIVQEQESSSEKPWGTMTNNMIGALAARGADDDSGLVLQRRTPISGNFRESLNAEESIQQKATALRGNTTGLPNQLKAGVESLSGLSMSDVRVRYNSTKPAQIQALAYTQGTNIHLGPGQEKHLPHEAWHVAQQKQGRVRATTQAKGMAINDQPSLEREADVMGERANQVGNTFQKRGQERLVLLSKQSNVNSIGLSSSMQAPQSVQGKFEPGVIQQKRTEDKAVSKSLTDHALESRENEEGLDLGDRRPLYEVTFDDGKLYGINNPDQYRSVTAYEEADSPAPVPLDGKMLFALSTDNHLYCRYERFEDSRTDSFTHANFMSGAPVKTAGELYVKQGTLYRMNNESGHYQPTGESLEWLLDFCKEKHVDLSHTDISMLSQDGTVVYEATTYDEEDEPEALSSNEADTRMYSFQHYDRFKRGINTIDFGAQWGQGGRDSDGTSPHWRSKIAFLQEKLVAGNEIKVRIWYANKKMIRGANNQSIRMQDTTRTLKRSIPVEIKTQKLNTIQQAIETSADINIQRTVNTRQTSADPETSVNLRYQDETWVRNEEEH